MAGRIVAPFGSILYTILDVKYHHHAKFDTFSHICTILVDLLAKPLNISYSPPYIIFSSIRNYTRCKVWDEITYPLPNISDPLGESHQIPAHKVPAMLSFDACFAASLNKLLSKQSGLQIEILWLSCGITVMTISNPACAWSIGHCIIHIDFTDSLRYCKAQHLYNHIDKSKSKSNQVYCHILLEEVYMSLTIQSLCQQHIEQ